ncbi:MAG: FxsA family protein [Bacteroidetes bacterium]|nr:FxsA family protein [Bacteroidota bacterium]
MFARLLALFVIVPALELYVLIRIGQLIGALETFGIILVTGLIGSYLAKTQGLSVWNRLQEKLNSGQLPGRELLDGVIILLSGALLLTPGVLTDMVGLMGLFPPTRAFLRKKLADRFSSSLMSGNIQFRAFSSGSNPDIDPDRSSRTDADSGVFVGGSAKHRPG